MKWFHRHRWKIISASCDGSTHWLDPVGFTLVTTAVGKCECGKLKSFHFAGNHPLNALKGEESEVSRVLQSLEE
jgi:hypothetical protein